MFYHSKNYKERTCTFVIYHSKNYRDNTCSINNHSKNYKERTCYIIAKITTVFNKKGRRFQRGNQKL